MISLTCESKNIDLMGVESRTVVIRDWEHSEGGGMRKGWSIGTTLSWIGGISSSGVWYSRMNIVNNNP